MKPNNVDEDIKEETQFLFNKIEDKVIECYLIFLESTFVPTLIREKRFFLYTCNVKTF